MFGYLRPIKNEEHENYLFKAHYCSLCKAIGKEYGNGFRIALSYDVAFMSFFLSALSGEKMETEYENCIVHPFRKRLVKKPTQIEKECSRMTAMLFSMKISDDSYDEKGFNKLPVLFMKSVFGKVINESRRYGFYHRINDYLKMNSYLENEKKCNDVDLMSNEFGNFLKDLICFVSDSAQIKLNSNHIEFTFLIGKWIYLIDALDDLEDDYKNGKYNVLKFAYSEYLLGEDDFKESLKKILDEEKWRMSLLLNHVQTEYLSLRNSLKHYSVEFDDIIFGSMVKITGSKLSFQKKYRRNVDEPL